jgi:hypothetical protein
MFCEALELRRMVARATSCDSFGAVTLHDTGRYRAIAVEWSGLESERSLPLRIQAAATLKVLDEIPANFSWTRERHMIRGGEVSEDEAMRSPEAVREIVHMHDGVIHREWLWHGQLMRRHDLNLDGKPIRRLHYRDGKLAERQYYDRDGGHVSTERFDADGFITESIRGRYHWWYQRGVPQRFENGAALFVNDGDRWIRKH